MMTDERLVKQIWVEADATLCQVLLWMALKYPPPDTFILMKWHELGVPLQKDICAAVDQLRQKLKLK